MACFSQSELATWSGGRWCGPPPPDRFRALHFDSRQLRPGDCFVALTCGERDGHDFLEKAHQAGATAALVSRKVGSVKLPQLLVNDTLEAYGEIGLACRQRFEGTVIGITGTAGKTSTRELIRLLLGEEGVHASASNFNNLIGVPYTLTGLEPGKHHVAVVEAGISEPGEMARLARLISPDLVVITSIGHAHLEGLGDLEGVAREKAQLAYAVDEAGRIFFPADCCEYEAFRGCEDRAIVIAADDEDVICHNPERVIPYEVTGRSHGSQRVKIWMRSDEPETFALPLWGPGMTRNAILALTVASRLHVPQEVRQTRLSAWKPAPMRGQLIQQADRTFVADCYNANPLSWREAIEGVRLRYPEEKVLFLCGCMNELGVAAERLHRELGEQWKLKAGEQVLLVGDHAEALAEGLRLAGASDEQLLLNPEDHTIHARIAAHRGVVLVKGSRAHALERFLPNTNGDNGHNGSPERRRAVC